MKVFIGTVVCVGTTKKAAMKDYNSMHNAVVTEDDNEPSSILEWHESDEYDVCEKCGRPNHKIHGHHCPTIGGLGGGYDQIKQSERTQPDGETHSK